MYTSKYKTTNTQMCNAHLILTWLKMKEYRSSPKLSVIAYKYVCKKKYDNFFAIMIGTNRADWEGRGGFYHARVDILVGIVYFRKKNPEGKGRNNIFYILC